MNADLDALFDAARADAPSAAAKAKAWAGVAKATGITVAKYDGEVHVRHDRDEFAVSPKARTGAPPRAEFEP